MSLSSRQEMYEPNSDLHSFLGILKNAFMPKSLSNTVCLPDMRCFVYPFELPPPRLQFVVSPPSCLKTRITVASQPMSLLNPTRACKVALYLSQSHAQYHIHIPRRCCRNSRMCTSTSKCVDCGKSDGLVGDKSNYC